MVKEASSVGTTVLAQCLVASRLGSLLFLLTAASFCSIAVPGCRADNLHDMAAYASSRRGDALVVYVDGKLVLEDYPTIRFHRFAPHMTAHGSELFSTVAAVCAATDGLIRFDEPVADTITEWQKDPLRSAITVGDLLQFVDGLNGMMPTSLVSVESRIRWRWR